MTDLTIGQETRTRIERALGEIHAPRDFSEDSFQGIKIHLDARSLPPPPLLHFLLVDVMDLGDQGRFEKTAWAISFDFESTPAILAYEKFGLRLYVWLPRHIDDISNVADQIALDVCHRLNKGVSILERDVLRKFADEQVAAGNVLVYNQYGSLRERYLYFRERARLSYDGQHLIPRNSGKRDEPYVLIRNFMSREAEGAHNTLAMVNAFFSLLEHTLVLLVPFVQAHGSPLKTFISARWGIKFKAIFRVTADSSSRKFYQQLHDVAEQWRNPYSHGGFDKTGGGIFIHFRAVGVVPASLADIRTNPELSFMPARRSDFTALCSLFDELEEWMRTVPESRLAMRYIAGGMNVSYDAASIDRYSRAQLSDEAFEEFCDQQASLEDAYANMDW